VDNKNPHRAQVSGKVVKMARQTRFSHQICDNRVEVRRVGTPSSNTSEIGQKASNFDLPYLRPKRNASVKANDRIHQQLHQWRFSGRFIETNQQNSQNKRPRPRASTYGDLANANAANSATEVNRKSRLMRPGDKESAHREYCRNYQRERRAKMSDEQKASLNEYYRNIQRKKFANMSDQQKAAHREYSRNYQRERRAKLSDKQMAARRQYQRNYNRERLAKMNGKQLAAHRRYCRNYQRKRLNSMSEEEKAVHKSRQRESQRAYNKRRAINQLESARAI
jgi:hypothetical protein